MQKRKRGASLHDGGGYGGTEAKNSKKQKKKKNTRRRHEIPTGDYFWKEQEDVLPAFGFPKLLEFEDGVQEGSRNRKDGAQDGGAPRLVLSDDGADRKEGLEEDQKKTCKGQECAQP